MRKLFSIILCLLILGLTGCSRTKPQPATQAPTSQPIHASAPLFKGVELWSWKPVGQDWHFSLIAGTNRNKWLAEVTDPQVMVIGVPKLKQRLATLAVGEGVIWRNGLPAEAHGPKSARPEPVPQEIVREVAAYCRNLQIKLYKP